MLPNKVYYNGHIWEMCYSKYFGTGYRKLTNNLRKHPKHVFIPSFAGLPSGIIQKLMNMKKSRILYGSIGTDERLPIDYNNNFIKYKHRWRLIQRDGSGAPFVDVPASGITQYFEILAYSPEETKELIDLYGE